jgi:hypothetical protein
LPHLIIPYQHDIAAFVLFLIDEFTSSIHVI